MLEIPAFLKPLEKYFVDKIPTLKTAKTIQIAVIRQTHDFTIFRTEETRELNVVTLPLSINNPEAVIKVAFLASKQKAPENRNYITLLRTFAEELGVNLNEKIATCKLKDALCRMCPRCVLFGAVVTEGGATADRWNIKHRIEYSTAYSLEPYERISELITFNAVDPETQSTGQALGYTENIRPIANFPSIVTLNSVTWHEFIWYMKTLLSTKSYGAETRVKGDVVNYVVGICAGFEEIITPLEFNLELNAIDWQSNPIEVTSKILDKYAKEAVNSKLTKVLKPEELKNVIEGVKSFDVTKEFIEEFIGLSTTFYDEVSSKGRSE
ncbi:MAG: type I-D CRISPR-associated protein Cas7/Csc2 [Candidatus Freyarchaeota archaeon]